MAGRVGSPCLYLKKNSALGSSLHAAVGLFVGLGVVGLFVGLEVGACDGLAVGACDGLAVGLDVVATGEDVGDFGLVHQVPLQGPTQRS